MTAKEYLSEVFKYENKIANIKKELDRLEIVATNISPTLSNVPHGITSSKSKMAEAVDKIIDKQKELKSELIKLENQRVEITAKITMIKNSLYREVLFKRYIDSKSWVDIAAEIYVSLHYVYKIHKNALIEFEKIL